MSKYYYISCKTKNLRAICAQELMYRYVSADGYCHGYVARYSDRDPDPNPQVPVPATRRELPIPVHFTICDHPIKTAP